MNKSQVKTKEDLELYYTKVRKIRFKENDLKFDSIESLFRKFIKADENDTYYKKGSLHCSTFKLRSIHDFILIAKNYFPEMKVKDILLELLKIINNPFVRTGNNLFYITINYCSNIRKNNFWYSAYNTPFWGCKLENVELSKNGFTNCNLTLKSIME